MSYITQRKRPLSRTRLATGIGLGTAMLAGTLAPQASAADLQKPDSGHGETGTYAAPDNGGVSFEDPQTLPEMTVSAMALDYGRQHMAGDKFTEPLAETPQTVQMISGQLMEDRQANTLTDALKNSAGVGVFNSGEAGRTATGDAIGMRGFDASSSIFVDGVRSIGSISRDVFNIEHIEVIKGSNSVNYGRTGPGGSINLVTKKARSNNVSALDVTAGSADRKKVTLDVNHQFTDSAAGRLNLMARDSGVPGRDTVNNKHWGIAPAVSFGLGTDTRVHLNYLHVQHNNIPDGGLVTIGLPNFASGGSTTLPLANPPKPDTDNFYGTDADFNDVTKDAFTADIEHDFSADMTLRNVTRWSRIDQKYLITNFYFTDTSGWQADDLGTWTLQTRPNTKDQTHKVLTNRTNIQQQVQAGSVEHHLAYGLVLSREKLDDTGIRASEEFPSRVRVYQPNNAGDYYTLKSGSSGEGTFDTAAAYLRDTMHFGPRWQLTTGVRLDHYDTDFSSSVVCGGHEAPACGPHPKGSVIPGVDAEGSGNLVSWQVGGVYNINEHGHVYASYARGLQPPGGQQLELSSSASSPRNPDYDPRESRTAQLGTKWQLADEHLLLTAALYRTEVTNLVAGNQQQGFNQIGEKRVQGVELSAVGRITPQWDISAGFTTQDASVVEGASEAADGSDTLVYTPSEAFTAWTTYQFPFGLTVGGGVRYSGEKEAVSWSGVAPRSIQAYTVVNAMARYQVTDNLNLQLNVRNLADEEYASAIAKSGLRYTPGQPRSFLLSMNLDF